MHRYKSLHTLARTGVFLSSGASWAAPASATGAAESLVNNPDHAATLIVVAGLAGLLTFGNLILSVWEKLRPKPPLHQQFAPATHLHPDLATATHTHADYICRKEYDRIRETCTAEKSATRDQILDKLDVMASRDEERASLLHTRVNAFSEKLNQLLGRFDSHIEQHRTERKTR